MMIRSGGFYHDDDSPRPQPLGTAVLAILLVFASAAGAAIVVRAWTLLLPAGR